MERIIKQADGSPTSPPLPEPRLCATLQLPNDTSSPGFGPLNEVLISKKDAGTIVKYQFKLEDGAYHEKWERCVPDDMEWDCYKFVLPSGHVVLHHCFTSTCVYSGDLQQLLSQHVFNTAVNRGISLKAASATRMVYRNHRDGKVRLDVFSHGHELLATLNLPAGRSWVGAAVCVNFLHDGRVVVMDNEKRCMDIFTADGEHQHHVTLTYTPDCFPHSSCASSTYILVLEKHTCRLHAHDSKTGAYIGCLDGPALKLNDTDEIWHVGLGANDVLQLCLISRNKEQRICAYTINTNKDIS